MDNNGSEYQAGECPYCSLFSNERALKLPQDVAMSYADQSIGQEFCVVIVLRTMDRWSTVVTLNVATVQHQELDINGSFTS